MQDNLILKAEKRFSISKPAFILLLISVMLTTILAGVTVKNIDRSQKLMEFSLLRQGTTMIHAFEAGARTSMLFRKKTGHNPLVDLATEVLKDTGVAYIRIIDEENAVIVSQGNVSKSILQKQSYLTEVGDSPIFSINWAENIFEVSKQFHPVASTPNGMSMMEMRWGQWNLDFKPKGKMYISVGFYTSEYEKTRQEDMYHTIFMLVMLLLLFFAGLYFLFLYHRMRVTHATPLA
jgi:two-component system sensor histidine kinase HydH